MSDASNTVNSFDPTQGISLTAVAQAYFAKKLAGQVDKIIRLSTKESGCTGFAYVLDLVEQGEKSDELYLFDKVKIAVASDTLPLISGTEIDVVQEGVNEVVKFNNPNVVAECGCGESFSVNDAHKAL
ncbi:iron-sulfur cluster assembly accessory protein [Marinomonas agarivorans]|nr:iron-sulfur cluster assembly accessory protein [Marinomonas agarivorans]